MTDDEITKIWERHDHTRFNLQSVAIAFARELLNASAQQAEPVRRFDLDMDGSMDDLPEGRWVRYEDHCKAIAAPAPASPAEYIKQLEKETSFAKTTLEATREAARSSPADQVGWQPIETAPKDGRMFLCWVDAIRSTYPDGEYGGDAYVSDHDFCQWKDSEHGGYFDNMMGQIGDQQQVTHWMPLPPAPALSASKEWTIGQQLAELEYLDESSSREDSTVYIARLRNGAKTWLSFNKYRWDRLDSTWDKRVAVLGPINAMSASKEGNGNG